MMGKRDIGKSLHTLCSVCEERAQAEERAERIRIEREAIRARILATIPPELLPKSYDEDGTDTAHPDFPMEVWRALKQWRPGKRGNWLGLVGPAGKCKTRLMALYAEMAMRLGVSLMWTTATRLHTESISLKSRNHRIQAAAMEHLADCLHAPYLFIDDLGKNEWGREFEGQFFTILDHRQNFRMPIIWSSNAHPEEFSQVLSDLNRGPIIGRLIERTDIFDFTPGQQGTLGI
jgi:DNA replication protein DnaC